LLVCFTWSAWAQSRVVKGRVTDESGAGLPGVNVVKKGTSSGTATDGSGNYSIEATSEDVLVISFIGYATQEVVVGSQTTIDVVLKEDVETLSEVVVTGYSEIKKAELSTAQTTISSEAIKATVNTTVEQALQGRSAGVYVTQNSGQPGGGMSVNIRGVSTISGTTEPLYVVDGVQIQPQQVGFGSSSSSNPLSGLNPADIDNIEILQGPAATSIYGSRGTNGVVIISTKRGKSGGMKIDYRYQHALQTSPKELEVMNLQQYAQMVNEYHEVAGGETPAEFLDPSILGPGTNWQDELFNSAAMNNHQVSLSGGAENITYYLSGDYLKQEGVALGSGFDRYSFRMNLDNSPRKWLKWGANFNFNQTKEQLGTSQENIISRALQLTPQIAVKNLDGTWGGPDPVNGANQYSQPNAIALALITTNEVTRRQFLGGINLSIDLAKGLQFRTSLNTNVGFSGSTYFVPAYTMGYLENPTSKLNEGTSQNTYWNWNQTLQYDKKFGDHSVTFLGIHEAQESTWKNVGAGRTGFVVDGVLDLNVGDPLTATNNGGHGEWAMESYMGRINYNFKDRYMVMGTVRTDGSVNFGPDNKWGVFPSVSLAWRLSEESFFNIDFINDLKLRFETGVTGNQGGNAGIYAPMGPAPTPWGTGFLPSRYSNPGLKWEETKTNNFGLNLGLMNNRIQVDFDYFMKTTDNLLLENPQPWYMGTNGQGSVGAPIVNIGSLENNGYGITINGIIIDNGSFKWDANLNLSAFNTKIKAFYSDAAAINRTSWWMQDWTQRAVVGQAPWLFFGYIEDGIFTSIEEIENSALPADNTGVELPIAEQNGVWVGDVKFRDLSGPEGTPDGIINAYDQTFIGNPWPKSFWGFTNNFSYKGFTLNVFITATMGNDIYNYIRKYNSNPNNINISQNMLVEAFDHAKVSTDEEGNPILLNPETQVARLSQGPNGNYARHTSRWVEDGSFVRIKNVTLTYNLPATLLSKQNIVRGARVSIGAQNLWTLTDYSGYDPEVGAYVGRDVSAANQAIGVDNGRYPLTPVYTFSVGVDF
jgi:TonB-linked SusC/RagA family outer membrane protein